MGELRKKFLFSAMQMYGINLADAVPNPKRFGSAQETDIKFSYTEKAFTGSQSFPDLITRGEAKIEGKSKNAVISGNLIGDFFNCPPVDGQVVPVVGEAGTIPAASTYTVTVANGAKFNMNLGVYYQATGIYLDRVAAGSEAKGSYSLDDTTGIYTFAADDASAKVKIDYLYNDDANGQIITITNQLMGLGPTFMAIMVGLVDPNTKNIVPITMILNMCTASALNIQSKKGEVVIPEFDFSAMADNADEIGLISLPK